MTKRRTIPALMAAATLGLGATAAYAEQGSQVNSGDLQKQIDSLQAQLQQLKSQQEQRAATPAFNARDVDATVDSVLRDADRRSQLLADGGGILAGHQDGKFIIRSADNNYSLQPYFQLQVRHVANFTDNAQPDGDTESVEGFEIRRMKIGFQGHAVSPRLNYNFRWGTDRNGGDLRLELAYITYELNNNWAVKVGQWKDHWTHEESTSSVRQLAVDRSLVNEMLGGGLTDYVQGIALLWDGGNNRAEFSYHDGANSDNTNFQDAGPNFGMSGRAEMLLQGDWRQYEDFTAMGNRKDLLVVGAGIDWSQAGDTNVVFHTVDVQWENTGGLGVYAAYVGRWVDLGGAGDASVCDLGFLGQVGYMLNRDWELFGRAGWITLDDTFLAVGDEDNIIELTIGFNYYIRGHTKITVDATWLPNGSPETHDGIGVLGQTGDDDQFILRGQFQLAI